jgi:GT2 family glycosyltransferase
MDAISSIGVCLLLRNSEHYIRKFLKDAIAAMEAEYPHVDFAYYIYENDSVDDTVDAIRDLVEGKSKCTFVTETLHTTIEAPSDDSGERIKRIVDVRNRFMSGDVRDAIVKSHQWCIFIDADIHFSPHTIRDMLKAAATYSNVAMITPLSIDHFENCALPNKDAPFRTQDHYYDTYAFTDMDGTSHWPNCIYEGCSLDSCRRKRTCANRTIRTDDTAIEVRAAWGGFALVRADAFRNPCVEWKTYVIGGKALCEHVYFCDMVRAATGGGKIVVCPQVRCDRYDTASPQLVVMTKTAAVPRDAIDRLLSSWHALKSVYIDTCGNDVAPSWHDHVHINRDIKLDEIRGGDWVFICQRPITEICWNTVQHMFTYDVFQHKSKNNVWRSAHGMFIHTHVLFGYIEQSKINMMFTSSCS